MRRPIPLLILAALLAVGLIPGARADAQAPMFVATFDGMPAAPAPFASPHWQVMVHRRDAATSPDVPPMDAAHGPACEPPPATHPIAHRPESAFLCHDHLMTAINEPVYGAVYLTPDEMVDFSAGEASVKWDMSTLRTSLRDWVDLWITPPGDALLMPLAASFTASGYGAPRNAVHVEMGQFNGKTLFHTTVYRDGVATTPTQTTGNLVYEDWLTPDAIRRDPFELRIGRTHVAFGMPTYGKWWIDTTIPDLGWDRAIVQFGHHSYTPGKDCPAGQVCGPNTWHLDNFSISPASPFTMVRNIGGDHALTVAADPTLTLAAPAPAGAMLRFHSQYDNQQVSFDGGATWTPAPPVFSTRAGAWPPHHTYALPVPAGVTSVRFAPLTGGAGPWYVRDAVVWGGTDAAPPTPTPVPTCEVMVRVGGVERWVVKPAEFCAAGVGS